MSQIVQNSRGYNLRGKSQGALGRITNNASQLQKDYGILEEKL